MNELSKQIEGHTICALVKIVDVGRCSCMAGSRID